MKRYIFIVSFVAIYSCAVTRFVHPDALRPNSIKERYIIGQPFSVTNNIKLTVAGEKNVMSWQAAYMVLDDYKRAITEKGYYVLGLASGATPIPLYQILIKFAEMGLMDFNKIKTFNMDEYEGLEPRDAGNMTPENPGDPNIGFGAFMYDVLFKPLYDMGLMTQESINHNVRIFESGEKDDTAAAAMCDEYEREITRVGGVDTWIGGVGPNGHIAFNEPDGRVKIGGKWVSVTSYTDRNCRSRKMFLTQEAVEARTVTFEFNDPTDPLKGKRWVRRDDHGKLVFGIPDAPEAHQITHEEALEMVPKTGFTIGIATYAAAKHQIILANGEGKADAISHGMEEPPNNNIGLSLLQDCQNCDLIIDVKAAGRLQAYQPAMLKGERTEQMGHMKFPVLGTSAFARFRETLSGLMVSSQI